MTHEPPVPAEREKLLARLDDMRRRCGEGHIDRQALSDLLDGLWDALSEPASAS